MDLADYVLKHTDRGECKCGQCIDVGNAPDPVGHTVDMEFFKVAAINDPKAATFRALSTQHPGVFNVVNPFDGHEHSYIELGGWIGDQGLALQYMALGSLLGVFELFTPKKMMPQMPARMHQRMAGAGYITVKAVQ